VVERNGSVDDAVVQVEHDPSLAVPDFGEFSRTLADRVQRKLKNDTNLTFRIEILRPNTLKRSLSKAKRVDDRRPKYRPQVG